MVCNVLLLLETRMDEIFFFFCGEDDNKDLREEEPRVDGSAFGVVVDVIFFLSCETRWGVVGRLRLLLPAVGEGLMPKGFLLLTALGDFNLVTSLWRDVRFVAFVVVVEGEDNFWVLMALGDPGLCSTTVTSIALVGIGGGCRWTIVFLLRAGVRGVGRAVIVVVVVVVEIATGVAGRFSSSNDICFFFFKSSVKVEGLLLPPPLPSPLLLPPLVAFHFFREPFERGEADRGDPRGLRLRRSKRLSSLRSVVVVEEIPAAEVVLVLGAFRQGDMGGSLFILLLVVRHFFCCRWCFVVQ
jgi:hypothetical protein